MRASDIINEISNWELHKWSSTSDLAYHCQVKGDLIRYTVANCCCTMDEQALADATMMKITRHYSALRDYARDNKEDFTMRHLSFLKQTTYEQMKHRYEDATLWGEINAYLSKINQMKRA